MSEIHRNVLSHLSNELDRPDLEKYLCATFGFLTGFEFRESLISISPNCTYEAKKGMVFQLCLGFANVQCGAGPISMCLGDCVVVNKDDCVVLTERCKRSIKSWKIVFQDENGNGEIPKRKSDEMTSKKHKSPKKSRKQLSGDESISQNGCAIETRAGGRSTRKAAIKNSAVNIERKNRQKELLRLVNEHAKDRLTSVDAEKEPESRNKKYVSYERQNDFPFAQPEVQKHQIYVDKSHNAVVLPIFDYAYPFHISTIKNVSETVEGQYCYLRINFTNTMSVPVVTSSSPMLVYIKELTYRASNDWKGPEISRTSSKLNSAYQAIRDHQKRFRDREAEKKEMEGVVRQGVLNVPSFISQAPPRLRDLLMRPNTSQKRVAGVLEGYENGVRYVTQKNEKVDILFSNVKHAFYQTCDSEMIIGLHFNLHNPIMIGKKKQSDIQFFRPVGEIATDLIKNRGRGDADEWEVEQAEREMKHKYKAKFGEFVKKIEEISNNSIRFETTIRELGFLGTPSRAMCVLTPTHSCLVNLTEWPPFVVTLDDIELVHFERVDHSIRNFDMVFIPKDYSKKVVNICSIDSKQLEGIKDWLTSCDIAFTEGLQNMNWQKVMRAIMDDYDDFFKTGGWDFLASDTDEENAGGDGESGEEDDAYEPSDENESIDPDDDEIEYDEDDSDEYSSGMSSESNSGDDDEDGSGKSWSELEEEAKREDAAKNENENGNMRNGGLKRHGPRRSQELHQAKKRR